MSADPLVQRLRGYLDRAGQVPERIVFDYCLRDLAKWRSQMLARTILQLTGTTIQSGPFAGMEYLDNVAEGALVSRLLGSYEAELHPYLIALADEGLDDIVDIGCAEGYYAVGLARLMPNTKVHAFDIDPNARKLCAELAQKNGVSVSIDEQFSGEDFGSYGDRTLIFVDIEGGEADLLDPVKFEPLRKHRIIVETHPGARPGVTDLLISRFSRSHKIQLVKHQPKIPEVPEYLQHAGSHLDMLLLAWEWRVAPTPWLVMHPG